MLRGREVQQAAIGALLERAHEGASGALVLRGEPGIGKTALLDYAVSRATDAMPVLRAAGVESEAELPFAGLHQLIRPVAGHLGALPEPQRLALSAAFGLTTTAADGAGDRFLAGLGALSLLAEIAPVLCLIDDAHWLDRASSDALLFAARRLHRDGIVMIFATRDYPGAFHAPGIPEIPLTGLDAAAAAGLLADRDLGTGLHDDQRDQLIARTRGNPLALIELSAGVAAWPTLGPAAAPVPVTSRVTDAFGHQLGSLPERTRSALVLAAADDTGDLSLLHRAGLDITDLQPAEERGLISVAAGMLEFRHPLIRAAAYHRATHSQRVAAHRALAGACAGQTMSGESTDGQGDRRAWHLAVSTAGHDEQVAAELEEAGNRAAARNAQAAAAAAFERAAHLSADQAAAARRLVLAAEAMLDSGQHQAARALAERTARGTAAADLTVRLLRVRALADVADGAMFSAYALNMEGAQAVAATDPERAVWMLIEAHHEIRQAHDRERIAATVGQLDALALPASASQRPVAWLIRWNAAMVLGSGTADYPSLDMVIAEAGEHARRTGPRAQMIAAAGACLAGRDDAMAEMGEALADDARSRGTIGLLPGGLSQKSWAEAMLGRYRDARISATEGRQLALDLGQPFWADWMSGTLAYLAAIEGDEQACRDYARHVQQQDQSVAAAAWAEAALIMLDLGYGRVAQALDRIEAAVAGPAWHHPNIARLAPDQVEAAVRLGRPGAAAEAVARFGRWAPLVGQPWAAALLARCQALTAAENQAERHYQQALARHERDPRPFDQARTQLVYGEWLRRAKRKREARIQLHAALRAFEGLAAGPWAARARAELTAAGATAPQAPAPDIVAALTPQELQITRLAARGLQNRDIAAQLFLSPRTVAYHLYKAYPKLGVSSRAELPAIV
jgi:DNA-binding CsgD family transcriptional regulator